MLAPIVRTWLNHKLNTVQELFEENITGEILLRSRQNIEEADQLINAADELMAALTRPPRGAEK